jgi:hypothetical protein
MTDHYIPKGVNLDTLVEIVAGWDAVEAASEPQHTSADEGATGITDAVALLTRFLEAVDILEAEGQKHRLTERGATLASALAADETEQARVAAHELLSE